LGCPELIEEFERKRKERKEKESSKGIKRKAEGVKERTRDSSPPPKEQKKAEVKKPKRVCCDFYNC